MDASAKTKPPARTLLDRAAWIHGAFDILADAGIDGIRVEVLAKRLGVTKGSFYWHFKDRRDLLDAVLATWREGRILDIRKQTSAEPGSELQALHHTIEVYSAARNRKGVAIEAAIRLWGRRDEATSQVIAEVDATRLECACGLFLALGLPEAEAKSRSVLLYAYVFGYSMMQCNQFPMDTAQVKRWIAERIAQ